VTSDSVMARKKLSLVFVALLSLCTSVQAEANFTLWVIRWSTNDFYRLNSKPTVHCGPNTRYLMSVQ
jgi:phenylacetate-coenzyme A ligase PaaK-like adenylate-forming protein